MPSSPIRLLLVEDTSSDRAPVREQIAKSRLRISLQCEETLEGAVEQLQNKRFDVVLVDLALPNSQGLENFRQLQSAAQHTPMIVLTSREDAKMASQALSEGAQDYLLKTRIDADALSRSIRYAVERARRQRAESELRAVGLIQKQLLPEIAPSVRNFDIAGRCVPAAFAGGDFFDFFSMGSGLLGVVIADAAGHGIASAMTMSETRAVIRAFSTVTNDVGEILTRANSLLQWDLTKETFVAAFLARIDVKACKLQFAAAGHPGYVLNSEGRNKQTLTSDDPPLGIDGKAKYHTSSDIRLSSGDSLFLFTDGLLEAIDAAGEQFGRRRVFEVIRERNSGGADTMLAYLFEQVQAYQDGAAEDDMTAAIVRAAPPVVETAPPAAKADDQEKSDPQEPTAGTDTVNIVAHEEYLYFEADKQGDVAVLRIREKEVLSSEKCADIKGEVVSYVSANTPARVVLSFQSVDKFSSEGINMCLHIKSVIESGNGTLHLCDMQRHVREAFHALNLDGPVFKIHDNIGKALSAK